MRCPFRPTFALGILLAALAFVSGCWDPHQPQLVSDSAVEALVDSAAQVRSATSKVRRALESELSVDEQKQPTVLALRSTLARLNDESNQVERLDFSSLSIEDATLLTFTLLSEDSQKDLEDLLDEMTQMTSQKKAFREATAALKANQLRMRDLLHAAWLEASANEGEFRDQVPCGAPIEEFRKVVVRGHVSLGYTEASLVATGAGKITLVCDASVESAVFSASEVPSKGPLLLGGSGKYQEILLPFSAASKPFILSLTALGYHPYSREAAPECSVYTERGRRFCAQPKVFRGAKLTTLRTQLSNFKSQIAQMEGLRIKALEAQAPLSRVDFEAVSLATRWSNRLARLSGMLDPQSPGANPEELQAMVSDLENAKDRLSELSEMDTLQLQLAMEEKSELEVMISNVMKAAAETSASLAAALKD